MRVIAAAETDAGICKPINQDGYCIKIAQTPAGQVALAAVCDGMGGRAGVFRMVRSDVAGAASGAGLDACLRDVESHDPRRRRAAP